MANTMTPENVNFIDPTSFKLVLERTPNVQFFCKAVNIPSVSVTEATIGRRQTNMPMLADKMNFDPLNITIMVDEDMTAYMEIYNWMVDCTLNSHNPAEVMSDLSVVITTSHNNASKTVKFSNAFPTAIGDLAFNSSENAPNYLTADVTFRFTAMDFE